VVSLQNNTHFGLLQISGPRTGHFTDPSILFANNWCDFQFESIEDIIQIQTNEINGEPDPVK